MTTGLGILRCAAAGHTARLCSLLIYIGLLAGCDLTTSTEERAKRADEHIVSGSYRSAMIELKNILLKDPNDVGARLKLSKVSLGLGDVASARKELTRAAELGADAGDVMPLHLDILSVAGEFEEILALLGSDPDGLSEKHILRFRGTALLNLGKSDLSAETFRRLIEIDADSVDAKIGLANSIAASGNAQSAIQRLHEITAEYPENVDAWNSLGILQYRAANYVAARTSFGNSLAHSKQQVNVIRHVQVLGGLIESELVTGQLDSARINIRKLSAISPRSPMSLFMAARLARLEQDFALAARNLQTLLNVSPDNMQAQYLLANVQMMQGNFRQAESLLTRVVVGSPDNVQARKLLAQIQLRLDMTEGASTTLAPILEIGDEDAELFSLLAEVNYQQGDIRSVIENLRAASRLDPDDSESKLNLVSAYLIIGEIQLAREVLQTVPPSAAEEFRRLRLLLKILVADEDFEGAIRGSDRAHRRQS